MDRGELRRLVEKIVREELARIKARPIPQAQNTSTGPSSCGHGVITAADVEDAARASRVLRVGRQAVITPLAQDRARELGVDIQFG